MAVRPTRYHERMLETAAHSGKLIRLGQVVAEAVSETLWPTRCAVCDAPGTLLCDRCRTNLPYLDHWRSCPRCGAPYGSTLCTECCKTMLTAKDLARLPFDACVSVIAHDPPATRLVTVYKDQGEQRLSAILASLMAEVVPPGWIARTEGPDGVAGLAPAPPGGPAATGQRPSQALTYVPSTAAAYRKRGFDHAELMASCLSDELGLPLFRAFERPRSKDQRNLGKRERLGNMEGRFRLHEGLGSPLPSSVILVDDVYTTGATLMSAASALRAQGVERIRCLTFARVW